MMDDGKRCDQQLRAGVTLLMSQAAVAGQDREWSASICIS